MELTKEQRTKEYMKKYREINREKIERQNAEALKKRRYNAQFDIDMFAQLLLEQTREGARKRKIKFSLNKQIIKDMLLESGGKCAISGLDMSTRFNCYMKASIDRIDSNQGYSKNNVQLVAGIVNRSKHILSVPEYIQLCRMILKNNGYKVHR